jgi:hypothetical protein
MAVVGLVSVMYLLILISTLTTPAGNIGPKDSKSPAFKPETTPTLKSTHYTTGRGGTGNMAKNDDAEEARRAQDVDVPGITMPEGSHHTGRGR